MPGAALRRGPRGKKLKAASCQGGAWALHPTAPEEPHPAAKDHVNELRRGPSPAETLSQSAARADIVTAPSRQILRTEGPAQSPPDS